jgi:hypothetical protein
VASLQQLRLEAGDARQATAFSAGMRAFSIDEGGGGGGWPRRTPQGREPPDCVECDYLNYPLARSLIAKGQRPVAVRGRDGTMPLGHALHQSGSDDLDRLLISRR